MYLPRPRLAVGWLAVGWLAVGLVAVGWLAADWIAAGVLNHTQKNCTQWCGTISNQKAPDLILYRMKSNQKTICDSNTNSQAGHLLCTVQDWFCAIALE